MVECECTNENKAFDEADGIASQAFIEICKVFEKLGLNSESQADWARTAMEKWS